MEIIVVAVVFVIFFLVVSGIALGNDSFGEGVVYSMLGIIALIFVLLWVPIVTPSGGPKLDMTPGDYKVAFVYVAGDNVSIGVEIPHTPDKEDRLFLYQFDKKAFDGDINIKAKKLVVVQAGSFKKLQLE